ncbi:hypothetical protein CLAIMM_06866 [Cladophialophora immunda]|nr:hypothetical protein CLAIMM_06866 [Cladophialophora immunda]
MAEYDEFSHLSWLEPMEAVVARGSSSPDRRGDRVGFCAAKLIRRTKIRGNFYKEMSKPFDEPTLLAFDLFDRFGSLKDDYENHATRKALRMWGTILDYGDILLIEDIIIEKPFRRLGLGRKIVTALLETTKRKTNNGFAAILWPQSSKDIHFEDLLAAIVGDSGSTHRPAVFDLHDCVAIPWARSLGFRRIGSSIWLGLECWHGQAIPRENDFDPPVFSPAGQDTLPKSIWSDLSDKRFLKAVQQYLQCDKPDSQRWFATDKEANTLLHLAALHFLPESVGWIMQQSTSAHLIAIRNSSGNNPLEALLQKLEMLRTRSWSGTSIKIVADDFEGHTIAMAKCIALFKGIETHTDKDLEQFRYGCTCGECAGGYLSPRMRFLLSARAERQRSELCEEVDNLPGTEWVEAHSYQLVGLPQYCLKLLSRYKGAREGYVRLCGHITSCLFASRPPHETTIELTAETIEEKPASIQMFYKCGGSIAGLITCIFGLASWDDEIYGDGFLLEFLDEDGMLEEEAKCRNDHEFVLVARKCGYDRTVENLKNDKYAFCESVREG